MQKSQPAKSGHICLGVVIGAHGIKGALRVKSFCEIPENIAAYGQLITEDGTVFTPIAAQIAPNQIVRLTLKEVTDRTQAEALKGTYLFTQKTNIPLAKDEILYADLLGQPVLFNNKTIGTLTTISSNTAQDILEIETTEKTILIPFLKKFVTLKQKQLHLTPAAEDFFNL